APDQGTQQLSALTHARTSDYSFAQLHASMAQLVYIRNHHHSVLYGDAEDRDETNYRRNAQREAGDQKKCGTTNQRDRYVENDGQRIPQRTKARVNQHEHEQQRDGYSDQQPALGLLRVFELPSPGDEV